MGSYVDITGQKYNMLTAIKPIHSGKKIFWECKCDCGSTVVVCGSNLRNGHTKSCGCLRSKPSANSEDLSGKRFGNLIVIEKSDGRKTSGGAYKSFWKCICDCGNETEVDAGKLRTGHTKSCGCLKKKGHCQENITGHRFGRLTVIRYIEPTERTVRGYSWWCRCDCGNEIKANLDKLKKGLQQSCGCLKEEMKPRIGEISRKYKYSNKRLYSVFKAMHNRCEDPNGREWENYGGRGIVVCPEWCGEEGYDNFAEWAFSDGYDAKAERGKLTLDRKDCNGNYTPENCRWIPNERQQNNKRTNVMLEYNGETHSMKDWSRILNVPYTFLTYHCRKKHETLSQAMIAFGYR